MVYHGYLLFLVSSLLSPYIIVWAPMRATLPWRRMREHVRDCRSSPGQGEIPQQLEKKGGTRKANGGPPVQLCLRPCHEHPGQLPRHVATNRVPKSDMFRCDPRCYSQHITYLQPAHGIILDIRCCVTHPPYA